MLKICLVIFRFDAPLHKHQVLGPNITRRFNEQL